MRRTIQRHDLLPARCRVVVAVSGGSDSVALTRILLTLGENGAFEVVGLAHFNHQLRTTADRDEACCRSLAQRLALPIVVEASDVAAHARAHGLSVEDAARRLRYAFLERAADSLGAHRIAVGHTQDDQAETFLLKLIRGAGLTGLAGIYPRRERVVRPLLDVTREELREYLTAIRQIWVEDETNDDVGNPRNRIRHHVLPELDRAARGATRPAIARAAALIREDGRWLDEVGQARYRALAVETDTRLELDRTELTDTPLPVLRRVLLEAMRQSAHGREIGLEHVEAVLGLLAATHGGIDVPGSRVELRGKKLVLLQQRAPLR